MRTKRFYIVLIIVAIIGTACGAQPAATSTETPVVAAASPATATATAVTAPTNETDLLLWEGPALFAEDQTECHRLRVTNDNRASVGLCAGEPTEVEFASNQNGGLVDMVSHFAPFQVDTPQRRVVFNGQGKTAGPAWERTISNWAQFTYAELATGHVGAANRTVLAWNLGENNGQCRMLLVLSHGYATTGLTPCAGGQMETIASGWIDTADWEQFDAWLYNRAPLYQDNNYFDGRGSTDMSATETAALVEWIETVYAKLAPPGSASNIATATPTAIAPAICPVPADGQQLLLSRENGYCLLYPAEYTLVQSDPGAMEIVKDSVINHIDPRVSIQVEDAAGRTLKDVARQLEADYVPPGFTVERGTTTVDGIDAVLLDNLPGQDINRRVALIQNGRLYYLFFAPLGDEGSEVRQQAESLYHQVLDSFRFLEATIATPTPTPAEIGVVPASVPYVLARVDVNIRSGPGTTYSIVGSVFAGQTAKVTGVTTDGTWWRVICPNGTVGNCFVIADPNLTQPTNAPGDEPADSVPERIEFQPGRISETIASRVLADTQPKLYVLRAQAGQTMLVRLTSTEGQANFSLAGVSDGQPLKRMAVGDPVWQGTLPLTQDYMIAVAPTTGSPANYQLYIEILPLPGTGTPERIQFAPGTTAATVYGFSSAIKPKRYILGAQGGQQMDVNLNTGSVHLYITVLTPGGENMAGADAPIQHWSGTLPVNGDYLVEVINGGTGLADFALTIAIE